MSASKGSHISDPVYTLKKLEEIIKSTVTLINFFGWA